MHRTLRPYRMSADPFLSPDLKLMLSARDALMRTRIAEQ
jgi:hypothetical protein